MVAAALSLAMDTEGGSSHGLRTERPRRRGPGRRNVGPFRLPVLLSLARQLRPVPKRFITGLGSTGRHAEPGSQGQEVAAAVTASPDGNRPAWVIAGGGLEIPAVKVAPVIGTGGW